MNLFNLPNLWMHLCRDIAKLENTEVNKLGLVIYTKPACPYCQQARDYYNSKGIPFSDYDAQNDRARRAEMFAEVETPLDRALRTRARRW